ncbi:MAG: agmatinase [Candidatus Hodarchaeales archaeon]|jgi:agmatinase
MEFKNDGYGSFGGLSFEKVGLQEAGVILQGIPYESATSGKKGTSFTPEALRAISKDMQTISRRGIDFNSLVIRDVGNVPIFPVDGKSTRDSIERSFSYLLSENTKHIISIGGDHSITYPMIKSLSLQGKVGIIWFDAHRDLINNFLGSQYSHGSSLIRAIELENVYPENVLLIGTRYMNTEEQEVIKKYGINELSMVELEESNNAKETFKKSINKIEKQVDNIYVSIDIDVLDPAFAPGTGTPVGGGMTTSELMNYIWNIPSKVRAFDIVEVSPPLDHAGITIKATLSILTEILAKIHYFEERD